MIRPTTPHQMPCPGGYLPCTANPPIPNLKPAGHCTGARDTGEAVFTSLDWHDPRLRATMVRTAEPRLMNRSATTGRLMRTVPAQHQTNTNSRQLDPIDRSWKSFPQYWIDNAGPASTRSEHAGPPSTRSEKSQTSKKEEKKKPLRTPSARAMTPAPQRLSRKQAAANTAQTQPQNEFPRPPPTPDAVKLASNELREIWKENYKARTFEQMGEPQHLMGKSTHQQRWNLFNFPTNGTHYTIPYHAAAASSMADRHEATAQSGAFRKWKRRPTDWQ